MVRVNMNTKRISPGDVLTDEFGREYVVLIDAEAKDGSFRIIRTCVPEAKTIAECTPPPVITKTEVYTGTVEGGESHSEPVDDTIPTDDNWVAGQEEVRERKRLEVPFRDERGMKVFKNADFTAADCAKIAKERELNSVPAEYTYLLDNILEHIKKAATEGAHSTYIRTALDFEKNFGGDIVTKPNTKIAEWVWTELRRRGFWFNIERSKSNLCPKLTDFSIWW